MPDILGQHTLRRGMDEQSITLGSNKLTIASEGPAFRYRRHDGGKQVSESLILTDSEETHLGIFPLPPLRIPKAIARNVYLKLKAPVIVDHRSVTVFYSKIPIEIGVYRQEEDEELLIDVFSLASPRYALYGTPEAGFVCRYIDAEAATEESSLEVKKYEEARVRIRVKNDIDNVTKVNKIIIPMQDVVLEHRNDETWLPGSVEMNLDTAFGKDLINVKLSDTKVKRIDKTSVKTTEDTLVFLMDAGY